jgi:hypothetical protein
MSIRLPLCVRLTRRALARRDAFVEAILRATRPARADAATAFHAFAFKNDERSFADELLARRTHLWLFRTNQRAFCGDFVAVDMSSPAAVSRRAYVLELKASASVRVGSGGVQMRNAARALVELSYAGTQVEVLTGDGGRILEALAP